MQTLTATKPRIDLVDALRGFALLGIIVAHMENQYFAGFPPPGHGMSVQNGADSILQVLAYIFVYGKFFTIFSFLFGLSFGIQLLNAREKGKPFVGRFAWRLLILFAIGFLHHMHYRGDILTIYAVLGFFLLLFYKAGTKWLLIWAIFFTLNGPGLIFQVVQYIQSLSATAAAAPPSGPDQSLVTAATTYFNHVKAGDYWWIAKTNIASEYKGKLFFQLFSGRLFITMGLFILGFYAARKRIFDNPTPFLKQFKKWLWIALGTAIIALASFFLFGIQNGGPPSLKLLIGNFLVGLFDPALSLVYVAAIVLLYQRSRWRKRLDGLAPLGRMGLSTYLIQSAFGLLFFYGYGLNLLDVTGNSINLPAAIAFFILQVYFSRWWMQRFYYGPFEWFWRSATFFKWQPFRKKQQTNEPMLVSPNL